MLDIHPPEHAVHTWRDFFIHIATIVIGLLIAIGLEQTVEALHHRHQMHLARERIHAEVEVNERGLDVVIDHFSHDLDILQADGKQPPPAESVQFDYNLQGFYNAAYNSAKDSGTLSLLPYDEAAMYSDAYLGADFWTQAMADELREVSIVNATVHGRSLSAVPPAGLQTVRQTLSVALGKARYAKLGVVNQQLEWKAILSGHYRNDITSANK
jgi:hypothetical protein